MAIGMRRPQAQPGRAIQKDSTPEVDTNSKENDYVSFKLAALMNRKRRSFVLIVCLAAALFVLGLNNYRHVNSISTTPLPQQGQLRTTTANEKQCTIWIAQSSQKGNDGFGIFTTRNIQKGDSILGEPDGVAIPITAYRSHKGIPSDKKVVRRAWIHMWNNYWWGRGVPDHVSYEADVAVVDYQTGFGSLPNHHCLLDSLTTQYPDPAYDDTLVNRFKDPGAGAFSYNMGREFIVTRDVVAGDELFLNYGYCKHDDDVPDWTKLIPMTGDFKLAAKMTWEQVHGRQNGVAYNPITGQLVIPVGTNKRVADLLPQTKAQLTELSFAVKKKADLPEYLAKHMGLTQRTPDWIRSHGMCMEHMVPRKSTLPQAGQGGVAQHRIRQGEMVVPVPLLQIMDKDALALFGRKGNRIGSQLLLNYCFGHPESSEYILCRPEQTDLLLISPNLLTPFYFFLGRSSALSGYERGLDQPLQQA
jgi:hypothetical protein